MKLMLGVLVGLGHRATGSGVGSHLDETTAEEEGHVCYRAQEVGHDGGDAGANDAEASVEDE